MASNIFVNMFVIKEKQNKAKIKIKIKKPQATHMMFQEVLSSGQFWSGHFWFNNAYWPLIWWVLCKAFWNFLRLTHLTTEYVVSMTLLSQVYFSASVTGRYITETVWSSWQLWNKMATDKLREGQTSTFSPLSCFSESNHWLKIFSRLGSCGYCLMTHHWSRSWCF